MSNVQDLYNISVQLLKVCENTSKESRDTQISHIQKLLGKREQMLEKLMGEEVSVEKEMALKLVTMTKEIDQCLLSIKEMVRSDIKSVSTLKQKQRHYMNPYANIRTDGMYYDKKM